MELSFYLQFVFYISLSKFNAFIFLPFFLLFPLFHFLFSFFFPFFSPLSCLQNLVPAYKRRLQDCRHSPVLVAHTERFHIQNDCLYRAPFHTISRLTKKTGFDAGATRERTSIPGKNVGGQNTTIKEWTQDDKMMNEKKRGNNPEKQERNNPVGRRPICVKP